MKLRIRDNTLRIRLTKSEVNALSENGRLMSKTEFVGQDFVYGIEAREQSELTVTYENGTIWVGMPSSFIQEWVNTDRVTFEGKDQRIELLLEKDFVCLDRPEEDQSDNYPNPNLFC